MKTQLRRLSALVRLAGLENICSSSTSDAFITVTCYFSFDLIKKIGEHKFKPDHGPDYLLYRRDPYWIFFHRYLSK